MSRAWQALSGITIQLARLAGLTVVADAAQSDGRLVRQLGADVVVRSSKDAASEVAAFRTAVPGGLDGVVDAAVLDDDVLPLVRDDGALATLTALDQPNRPGRERREPDQDWRLVLTLEGSS